VTRDLKNYIKKHSKRSIPVGYSAADVRDILVDTWNYLQCTTTGDDTDASRVDVFALNSYSWCGDSSFTVSGYDQVVSDLAKSSVPIFFSEYGCNVPAPRIFTEVPVIYSPLMTGVLSGGMVFEFSQEPDDFGLVTINADGSASLLGDFDTLQKQYASLTAAKVQGLPAQKNAATAPKCSASIISSKTFNNNFDIPAVPPGAQELIDNGIAPAPVGKIVPVTKTKVPQAVQDTTGKAITGLAIVPAKDQSNIPVAAPSPESSTHHASSTHLPTSASPSTTSARPTSSTHSTTSSTQLPSSSSAPAPSSTTASPALGQAVVASPSPTATNSATINLRSNLALAAAIFVSACFALV
jgi:hypothetical protein